VLFSGELDLLEVRLRCNSPYVDAFVVIEATRAFDGSSKRLEFAEHRERYSPWLDKIRHVVVTDMPDPLPDRWKSEVHQRNQLIRGLEDAEADDVIVISDADEIVHPQVMATLKSTVRHLTGLEMASTFFRANWRVAQLGQFATAVRALPFHRLTDAHHIRNHVEPVRIVRDAGRHFTYLLDPNQVQAKFATYAHAELDNPRDRSIAHIARAHTQGMDLWSKSLVRVVPAVELCTSERVLLELRPDLFDFRAFDRPLSRWLFRWYAEWRSSQAPHSSQVAYLDEHYDSRSFSILTRAAQAAALTTCCRYPRYALRTMRQFLRDL
jgi:Glycosyltransferase family 17